MKNILLLACIMTALKPAAQNTGVGTTTPQRFLHIVDSANNTNVLVESPATSLDKDVALELKQANGTADWLRIKKYSFLSPESVGGVSLTGASTIFSGLNAGDLKIGALYGNSQVDVFAGGQRRMIIGATGNVGIGSGAVPAAPLHIVSPSYEALRIQGPNAAQTFYNNSSYVGYLQAYQNIMSLAADGTNRLGLFTLQTERFTILPNGNIGINNSIPNYKLDVNGSANFGGAVYANNSAGQLGQTLTSTAGGTPAWAFPTNRMYNYAQSASVSASGYSFSSASLTDIPGLLVTFTTPVSCKVMLSANIDYDVTPGSGIGGYEMTFVITDENNTNIASGNTEGNCGSFTCTDAHFSLQKIHSFAAGTHTIRVRGLMVAGTCTAFVTGASVLNLVAIEQ